MMEVIFLLQAKFKNGKLLTLFELTKWEIEKLRSDSNFYCPTCNEKVIIKAGPKMIAHFAHLNTENCHMNERGEGEYHEKGKLFLYRWLLGQGLDVSLEEYLSPIKQRADILVKLKGKIIAIEFQSSRIPIQDIAKRTYGYLQEGIQPIWILGANLLQRTGKNMLKVDQFTLQFLQQYNRTPSPFLYFFDPESTTFITAANLFQTKNNRMIANLTMRKLDKITFLDLFKFPTMSYDLIVEEWKKAKSRFRLYQPRRLYGKELAWYKWIYYKGTHREYLSSLIYLPVIAQYRMNTPPWDWQSRICLEVIDPLPIGAKFSLLTCRYQLQKTLSKHISPLIKSSKDPVLEYLQILCFFQIIKQTSNNVFIKCNEVPYYTRLEDAIVGDKNIMNELSLLFKSKYEHDS
jgi:competence protein CoiA